MFSDFCLCIRYGSQPTKVAFLERDEGRWN